MNNLDPRNKRALTDSIYTSIMNNTEATTEEIRDTIDLLLSLSKGGRKNQASRPEEKVAKLLLTYAKRVLSPERYEAIGEEWVAAPGMTREKLDFLSDEDLYIETIKLIGGENLSNEKMTDGKLEVITQMGTREEIKKYGGKALAEMTMGELNEIA